MKSIKNHEGYSDPTAYYGTRDVIRAEDEVDKRAHSVIAVLKMLVRSCGFELIERIKIRDTKTGKEYR